MMEFDTELRCRCGGEVHKEGSVRYVVFGTPVMKLDGKREFIERDFEPGEDVEWLDIPYVCEECDGESELDDLVPVSLAGSEMGCGCPWGEHSDSLYADILRHHEGEDASYLLGAILRREEAIRAGTATPTPSGGS